MGLAPSDPKLCLITVRCAATGRVIAMRCPLVETPGVLLTVLTPTPPPRALYGVTRFCGRDSFTSTGIYCAAAPYTTSVRNRAGMRILDVRSPELQRFSRS
jgi:hypothetical protein